MGSVAMKRGKDEIGPAASTVCRHNAYHRVFEMYALLDLITE
jgi:hypothetical protein